MPTKSSKPGFRPITAKNKTAAKSKPAPKPKAPRRPKPKYSLAAVVGPETYKVWTEMLATLVPDGRTHRLAVVVAGMAHYASDVAGKLNPKEWKANPVAKALLEADESGYDDYGFRDYDDDGGDDEEDHEDKSDSAPTDSQLTLRDLIQQLFRDAGVVYERRNARGQSYSIAESAYEEYMNWFNMPWD